MNLTKLKSASEMKLPGISVEFVQESGSLTEVILKAPGSEGYSIRLTSYSMAAWARSSYEEKEVYRLTGNAFGIEVNKDFDDHPSALRQKEALEMRAPEGSPDVKLTIEKIKVKVLENAPAKTEDNDIPF